MIDIRQLEPVGLIGKPHGINGEVSIALNDYALDIDLDLEQLRCIVLDIDGIMVPFFIESARPKSNDTDLLTIDGIANETEAKALTGKTAYALREDLPYDEEAGEGVYVNTIVGFKAYNGDDLLGVIDDIDTTTDNALFVIERPDGGAPLLIPAVDEFITALDLDNRRVTFSLPEGLLDL